MHHCIIKVTKFVRIIHKKRFVHNGEMWKRAFRFQYNTTQSLNRCVLKIQNISMWILQVLLNNAQRYTQS